ERRGLRQGQGRGRPAGRGADAVRRVVSQPPQLPHPTHDRPAHREVPPAVEVDVVRGAQAGRHDALRERLLGGALLEQTQRCERRAAQAVLGGQQIRQVQEVVAVPVLLFLVDGGDRLRGGGADGIV